MALEIRKTSQWWYGRWMQDGKRHCARLKVKVEGKPGDADFIASSKEAQTALETVMAGYKKQQRSEDLVQELHRVRYGRRIGRIPLVHLFAEWKNIPRKRQPKDHYVKWAERTFKRLIEFVRTQRLRVKDMAAVDKKIAEAFMRHEEARKISPKTYNAELILLRGAFEHLREDAGMATNPFGKIVTKDRDTIHRRPFSREELGAVIAAAKGDALMYPLILVGVCTAMRRGDACLLTWEAIDLKNKYITVKTSKTGETAEIPIISPLIEYLAAKAKAIGGDQPTTGFVFPELAALYRRNPDGVNRRLGEVFMKAGFINADELKERNDLRAEEGLPPLDIARRGDSHFDRGEHGLHTANVRGFHSLRVTWITIALAAGIPMDLVRRVTGHKAVEVVLKNYFKPGRKEFTKVIEGTMPDLLLGKDDSGEQPAAQEGEVVYGEAEGPGELLGKALERLDAMPAPAGKDAAKWRVEREQAATLIRLAKQWVDSRVVREVRALAAGAD